jgi:molybdopterin synthase catalytic subunit
MIYEVSMHYYAAARELAGCQEEPLALPGPSVSLGVLRELLTARHASLGPHLPRMRFAINDEFCARDAEVRAGDAVSVLPPVAGGSDVQCALLETPLSLDAAVAAVRHPGAGGLVLFLGIVRDHAEKGAVSRLDYEAHTALAQREMLRVAHEVVSERPGVRLSVQHRVGSLAVGDIAVVVAASAAHRGEAFDACRAAIDRIKESVPIWKKEWAPDGSALWVNLEETR